MVLEFGELIQFTPAMFSSYTYEDINAKPFKWCRILAYIFLKETCHAAK